MTLVEVIVSMAIAGILLAVVASVTVNSTRSMLAMTNYNELDRSSRETLDRLTRDVRQGTNVWFHATNYVGMQTLNGGWFYYYYNPLQRTLTRYTSAGAATLMLTNCDYLTFRLSQRNPSSNFTFYPANSLASAKLIDVDWKCSREIKQQKVNTESIQTAKIVIRN